MASFLPEAARSLANQGCSLGTPDAVGRMGGRGWRAAGVWPSLRLSLPLPTLCTLYLDVRRPRAAVLQQQAAQHVSGSTVFEREYLDCHVMPPAGM